MDNTRIQISLAICRDDLGRVVVGNRPKNRDFAGLLEFPGGRIEPGESPQVAAIRELMEEANLPAEPTGQWPAFDIDYPHAALRLFPVLCRPVASSAEPGGGFRWVEVRTLRANEFPPANAELIGRLIRQDDDHAL